MPGAGVTVAVSYGQPAVQVSGGGGFNNLTTWPNVAGFRPTFNSGTNTLSWIGPIGGGPSTSNDPQQSAVLTDHPGGSIDGSSANFAAFDPPSFHPGLNWIAIDTGHLWHSDGSSWTDLGRLFTAGTLDIFRMNVTGGLFLGVDITSIKQSRIDQSGATFWVIWNNGGNVTSMIEDCEILGSGTTGFAGNAYGVAVSVPIIRRCNAHSVQGALIASPGTSSTIDCWVHDPVAGNGAHLDGIAVTTGFPSGATIEHNYVYNGNVDTDCIILQGNGGTIDSMTVSNNYLKMDNVAGGYYIMYADQPTITNLTVKDNIFDLGSGGTAIFNHGGVSTVGWNESGNTDQNNNPVSPW